MTGPSANCEPIGPLSHTSRGFERIDFQDAYGEKCSMQISSACRDEALLWLGINEPVIHVKDHPQWKERMRELTAEERARLRYDTFGRMHLTQSQVRALLPRLQAFAALGTLEVTPDEYARESAALNEGERL